MASNALNQSETSAKLEMELIALRDAAVRLSFVLHDLLFEMDGSRRHESGMQTKALLQKVRQRLP